MIFLHENGKCQSVINYHNSNATLSISSKMEIFEDKTANYSVNEIINNPKFKFNKTTQDIPSYSFTKSSIWCRFKLKNTTDEDCFLEISPPILNEVILYQVFSNRIDSIVEGSFYVNSKNKAFKSNNYTFRLDSEADYYLLKVKSKTRLFIKAQLGSFKSIFFKTKKTDTIQGIYAGLVVMIFIYNLFLFFTSRENVYLFYLLHLINSGLFFLYVSGFGIEYLWSGLPEINSYFITVMALGFILSLLFVSNFLNTRKNLPIVHKLILLIMLALILISAVDILISSYLAGKLLNYVGFAAMLLIVVSAIKLVKNGFKPAYTFLYAWLLYLVGIAVQTMQSLNFIPTNELTSNTIQIGSAFEIILLSLAVGNKINFYKEKKIIAISGEKELLKQKESLKSNQKYELEKRFQEQTELVYSKNRELKKQNKEIESIHEQISDQNKKILEYNALLEAKNRIITKQNEDLNLHKENLEQIIDERTHELKEATLKAEKADQLKTAFLKDFSHEIRTPMNAIAGFSSLLMDIDPEDKLYDYYAEIITNHTDNLLDLIDNIVDLSRIQTNSLQLKKVKFDPFRMFSLMHEKLSLKLKNEKKSFINLLLILPDNKDIKLNVDYNRFSKIIYQMVDNSIKYTDAGYIEFGFKQIKNSKDIEVFVTDTGVGIKKEKLEFVFDSFRKIEDEANKLYSGMGLGLSLVKGLVGLMGGEVVIETVSSDDADDKQTGTTIRVLIPDAIV